MMDSQRNFLIISLLFVSFIIWKAWEQDKKLYSEQQGTNASTITVDNIIKKVILEDNNLGKHITVKNDVLKLTINTRGGDIQEALLLKYAKNLGSNKPFQLLKSTPKFIYQAQSGLIGCNGLDDPIKDVRPIYKIQESNFALKKGEDKLIIPITYTDPVGNVFTKTFTMKRGEYTVKVDYTIQNSGLKPLKFSFFGQLKQSVNLPSDCSYNKNTFSLHTFRGAAYSSMQSKYEKYKLEAIVNNKNLSLDSKGGWVAMLQQYFATAWIPPHNGDINNFYTTNLGNNIAVIGYKSKPITVLPGQTGKLASTIWIGPEIQDKMASVAPYLDLTVDYGWLWFISQPLFKLLKLTYNFLGNWGVSIIAITFIVRGITYPLTKAQYTSMAKMRMLQPKIQAIRERLANNKQRQNQEIMAIYKSEKINPLGGCLPVLIQMPIFLALYYTLIGSVELRHAPFTMWIHDLSAQDPYYVLPVLMGITMLIIQKMSQVTAKDPMQKKIMSFTPIIFTIFFLWFPSGLVLYYVISNLMTIIQQQLIYHELEKRGLYKRKKAKYY